MRIREPKTTALIFASGKMVITGAKSEEFSRLAARKYARIIQKLGFNARFSEFKIQNIVGSCDVKFPIRLEGLAFAHGNYSSVPMIMCLSDITYLYSFFPLVWTGIIPRTHLSHGQTKDCLADLCVRQDCPYRCKGAWWDIPGLWEHLSRPDWIPQALRWE